MPPAAGLPAYRGEPVVVAGAGPVGQSAALLLARWGIPTVVLDRLPARERAGSKSICQHRDVLDVWEEVGAGSRVAAEGVTWTTARTFYREHELSALELRDRGRSPFPPFVNVSQSRTEEILDACMAAQPLVEVRWQHEVTGMQRDPGGVTVTCATPAGPRRLRAPYALVCAGAHADGLRAALGVSFDGRAFDDRFLICDIRARLEGWRTERRFYFDPAWNPDRQVLIHPCPEGTYRIDWQVPPDFDLAAEEVSGGLDARVRAIVGDAPYEIVWRSVYRFQSRLADRMAAGRVLLAGDAAHLMAPFGARGLNSGVADAENAAWKIAFALHGWAGERLLESYHDERLAAARENLEVTSETMRFLVPRTPEERAHRRETLERAVREPAARSQVNSGRLYEPFWYARSALVTPDPSRPEPGRPPAGEAPVPAPGVLVPDLPLATQPSPQRRHDSAPAAAAGGARRAAAGGTRLRALARSGLLALATDGADGGRAAAVLARATPAPARVLRARDIDLEGTLAHALGTRPGEVWLVRPDAHVAAVVPGGEDRRLAEAARRALGHDTGTARQREVDP